MGLKTRDELLGFCKRRYAEVEGLPLSETIRIQSLTEYERAQIEIASDKDLALLRVLMVQKTVVNEDGELLFGESDVEMLKTLDSAVIGVLASAIQDHCNETAIELDEAVKN